MRDEERNVDEMWRDVKTVLKESADCTIRRRCRARRIKELNGCYNKRKEIPVKDRNGNLLTKDNDIKIGGRSILKQFQIGRCVGRWT